MPIRIVLVAAVVFMAAWFTVLRPKPEAIGVATPAAPATSGGGIASKAGDFKAKAKAGAATAERDAAGAANANIEDNSAAPATTAATGTTAGTTAGTATATQAATPVPPLDAKALAKLPKPIAGALEERKVLVLGVLNTASKRWAPMAEDDRQVRDALKHVNRYGGEVAVRTAPVGRLSKYEGLLGALSVSQTPTVVIVDRDRHATELAGYWDRKSLNQAIVDARRVSTDKLIKDEFLATVNRDCARSQLRFDRLDLPSNRRQFRSFAAEAVGISRTYARRVARIPAPPRWRPLRGRMTAAFRHQADFSRQLAAAYLASDTGTVVRLLRQGKRSLHAEANSLDRRLNAVGLTNCTVSRTQ